MTSATPPAWSDTDPPVRIADVEANKAEFEKARYDALLADWAAQRKASIDAQATREAQDAAALAAKSAEVAALRKGVQDAYLATAQSSLDRALTRSNVVTGAAGAITTVYSALLALVYAAKDGKQLTAIAILPAVFLGMSLFGVTIYTALLRQSSGNISYIPAGRGGNIQETRLNTYMNWCVKGIVRRAWALRAGVASLGVGVATLPVPFVPLSHDRKWLIADAGLIFVILVAAYPAIWLLLKKITVVSKVAKWADEKFDAD